MADTKKSQPIKLKIKATIEVTFNPYSSDELNTKAKEQIAIWVEESLKDDDQVPLFVASNSGEETLSKTIKIDIEK